MTAGRVHGVLITFRRPQCVREMLDALERQTLVLQSLVVVDNDDSEEVRELVESRGWAETRIEYLGAGDNLGPAGGLHRGMSRVLEYADPDDWVVGLDDDDPPARDDNLADLVTLGEQLRSGGSVGGVGLAGSRLDRRSGRLVPPSDEELEGAVPVDYIGGNHLPMYSVAALTSAGVPDPRLFFGFDDLELGLKLGGAGFPLYRLGRPRRTSRGPLAAGRSQSPQRRLSEDAIWRRYYSLRNLVWLLRRDRLHLATVRVVVGPGLLKPLANVRHSPKLALSHLLLNVRAVADGLRGRLGRTVEPVAKSVDAPKPRPSRG